MKSIAAFFLVLSGFVLGQVPKGQDLILKGPQNVPVSGVVDGVVVGAMKRQAKEQSIKVHLDAIPEKLASLATVYGLSDVVLV